MDGSDVRALNALGMTNGEHSLFQYLMEHKGLENVIRKTAKKFSYSRPDREDDLVQALKLEAIEYCSKDKRSEEAAWQSFYGLKTRLHGEAMRVSVNLSGPVEKPDGKEGRRSREELEHGDEETRVDPETISGHTPHLLNSVADPLRRCPKEVNFLVNSYRAYEVETDKVLDRLSLEGIAVPFYTNCKLVNYERIHLLFDRIIPVETAGELLGIRRKTLQNWYDRTCDRFPHFDHRRKLTDKQNDEIARVKRKWKHVK